MIFFTPGCPQVATNVEVRTTNQLLLVLFYIRAVYTRESKLQITQSAAYVSRELSHLYDNSLHKKLVRCLRKLRTSISCRLYEQFAAYISNGLCNPRLYVSRELSHLYDNSLHKKLVRGLRKPWTSISCRLYEQFAAYVSRGLCNPRLTFPRINRPIIFNINNVIIFYRYLCCVFVHCSDQKAEDLEEYYRKKYADSSSRYVCQSFVFSSLLFCSCGR